MTHIDHDIIDRFGIHDFSTLLVNDLALVVHHVVVLHDLLTRIVVARLDLLLRGLDRFRKPL